MTVKITLSAIQHLIPLNVTQSNFFKLASKSHLFSNPNLFLSLNNCPNFVTLKPKRILNNFYFLITFPPLHYYHGEHVVLTKLCLCTPTPTGMGKLVM